MALVVVLVVVMVVVVVVVVVGWRCGGVGSVGGGVDGVKGKG